MTEQYYVVDVRPEWKHRPYVSLWGANNSGYHYTMVEGYAGTYTREQLDPGYHYKHVYGSKIALLRFPVPVGVCHALGELPSLRQVEVPGLVLPNTGNVRSILRRARLVIGDPSAFHDPRERRSERRVMA